MNNIEAFLKILELLHAKQRVAMRVAGEKFTSNPDYWKSFVDWYFCDVELQFFLVHMDWKEWFPIAFHDFWIVSQEDYALFCHSSVCRAVGRMRKLKEMMMQPSVCADK